MIQQQAISLLYQRTVLGTAGLGGVWGKVNREESVQTILDAFCHGILAVDTAPAYGDAESFIGAALKLWKGEVPVVSTKVGRLKSYATDECYYDYTDKGMMQSVERSLYTLNIPFIDVLFLHEPSVIPREDIERIVSQMQYFKQIGYTKKIGLGGNFPQWYHPYITSGVFDVVMEYNRMNACCIDALQTTLPLCTNYGVSYYAASPLNMGLLGCNFDAFVKSPPGWLAHEFIVQAQKVNSIAKNYGIPLTALAHRFLLSFSEPFKIVLGAANQVQLKDTLTAIGSGVLPGSVFNELLNTFNLYQNASDR